MDCFRRGPRCQYGPSLAAQDRHVKHRHVHRHRRAQARSSQSQKPTKEDRHFVTALARGLQVLACFRSGDSQLGNQELAERCGLPKSTVSRLTMTLTRLGYLIQTPDTGRYRLGMATLSLGSAMLSRLDLRQVARPLMQELAAFSGASVSLGARDRLSMIYIEHCRGPAGADAVDGRGRAHSAGHLGDRPRLPGGDRRSRSAPQIMDEVRAERRGGLAQGARRHRARRQGPRQAGRHLLVRRLAKGRERHRPRLPARRRPAAHGHQLRRCGVQACRRISCWTRCGRASSN